MVFSVCAISMYEMPSRLRMTETRTAMIRAEPRSSCPLFRVTMLTVLSVRFIVGSFLRSLDDRQRADSRGRRGVLETIGDGHRLGVAGRRVEHGAVEGERHVDDRRCRGEGDVARQIGMDRRAHDIRTGG